MKQKLIAKVLLMTMLCTALVVPASALEYGIEYQNKPAGTYSQVFSDVPSSHWAFAFIGDMQRKNIINGYPDGKFYPENFVERCEFAKIMVGASDLPLSSPETPTFMDVKKTDWFYSYVETASSYLTGYQSANGRAFRYCPNQLALREDIAVALVKLKGYNIANADLSMLKTMFKDYYSISAEAAPYIATAVERGLVSGYEDGTFRGQDSITRAEAAAMLWRANQYGNDNKVTDVTKSENLEDKKQNVSETPRKEDTEEEKITPEKKVYPYAVKTLVEDVNVSSMTLDGDNNVYYIDQDDNALYKVNAKTGKKSTVIKDFEKYSYQEKITEIETVTTMVPKTVRVEVPAKRSQSETASKDDEELVEESAEEDENQNEEETIDDEDELAEETTEGEEPEEDEPKVEEPEEEEKSVEESEPTYREEIVYEEQTVEKEVTKVVATYWNYAPEQVYYYEPWDIVLLDGGFKEKENENGERGEGIFSMLLDVDKGTLLTDDNGYGRIICSLAGGQIIMQRPSPSYSSAIVSLKKGYVDSLEGGMTDAIGGFQKGNKAYVVSISWQSNLAMWVAYLTEGKTYLLSTEFDIDRSYSGINHHSFFFWNIEDGTIKEYNGDTEKFRTLDINTKENLELEDGYYIRNTSGKQMLVTSDESFIFYDNNAGALRMIYKK